jgi:hypothetical protein
MVDDSPDLCGSVIRAMIGIPPVQQDPEEIEHVSDRRVLAPVIPAVGRER